MSVQTSGKTTHACVHRAMHHTKQGYKDWLLGLLACICSAWQASMRSSSPCSPSHVQHLVYIPCVYVCVYMCHTHTHMRCH